MIDRNNFLQLQNTDAIMSSIAYCQILPVAYKHENMELSVIIIDKY